MSSLKILKRRIKSVNSTQKITRAMQLISASRMNKAKSALFASRDYCYSIMRMTKAAFQNDEQTPIVVGKLDAKSHRTLIIGLTSDRGLCGAFNANIIRKIQQLCKDFDANGEAFSIACIGKRGYEYFANIFGADIVHCLSDSIVEASDLSQKLTKQLIEDFDGEKFTKVIVIYNRFISVIHSEIEEKALIPLLSNCEPNLDCYGYEPLLCEMQDAIIEQYLQYALLNILLEHNASEHSARMTAMDSATRNAKKMLYKLSTDYNRTRQAMITKELMEIISGAEVA